MSHTRTTGTLFYPFTTASQTVGPFFAIGMSWEDSHRLAGERAKGERIAIGGRVLDEAGAPVPDALVELWQADADGHHAHPADANRARADKAFRGFGRAATDDTGRYRFETVKPGRVAAPDGTMMAPHINVGVFARGLLCRLATRIYFPGDPGLDTDPVLARVPAARRPTLIARKDRGKENRYRFDIQLGGAAETVFFEF